MGSLASGLFDLFSGNPTSTEQNQFGDLYNYEQGIGRNALNAGNQFYQDILSGDPAKIAQALAPEIKAGQGQVEQQALTGSEFGNRAGGTNAATQAAQDKERGNIINLIGGLQQGAAGAETGIGEFGLSQAPSNLASEAGLAQQNQQRLAGDVGGIVQGAASIAAPFFGGGGMANDPYQTLYNAQHSDTSSLQPEEAKNWNFGGVS